MGELEIDTKGKYLSSANNINLIFANDVRLKGLFKHNEFDGKRYVFGNIPWRKIAKPEAVKNVDYSGVRNYIESIYGITGNLKIEDSMALEFERNVFHPVMDYLEGVKWDGKKRVDTLLIDYLGADDNIYTREAIRKTLVGAVARIFRPGCKFDMVLTLIGDQGTGKSTIVKKLGGKWFSDTFMTVHGKEALEQIQGAWIIEMAELSGLRKADVESTKHFISKQEDTFRPAYARTSETYKRQCIFVGTSNKRDFLNDSTGNRRFNPVDVGSSEHADKNVWDDLTDSEIDNIWAEAVTMLRDGESLFLSKEADSMAKVEQKNHSSTDERSGIISEYLDIKLPENWDTKDVYQRRDFLADESLEKQGTILRDYVCVAEIWCECLGKEKTEMDRYKTREINEILRGLGDWEQSKSTKNFKNYGKQKYYSRKLY
jgi:predicted P-loop ATPase